MSDAGQLDELLFSLELRKYVILSCITIYIYDIVLLFPEELTLIWLAPWTTPKTLYILSRYLPLSVFPIAVHLGFHSWNWPNSVCLAVHKFLVSMVYVCMFFPEVVFAIRTWAVWGRNRWIGIFLFLFTAGIWLPIFVLVYICVSSMQPLPISQRLWTSGCVVVTSDHFEGVLPIGALMLLFYAVSFTLMLVRMLQEVELRRDSVFLITVYLEGSLYYFYLALISLACVLVNALADDAYMGIFVQIQQTFCGVLACRMILELRGWHYKTSRRDITDISWTTEFATRDMGAITFRTNSVAARGDV